MLECCPGVSSCLPTLNAPVLVMSLLKMPHLDLPTIIPVIHVAQLLDPYPQDLWKKERAKKRQDNIHRMIFVKRNDIIDLQVPKGKQGHIY